MHLPLFFNIYFLKFYNVVGFCHTTECFVFRKTKPWADTHPHDQTKQLSTLNLNSSHVGVDNSGSQLSEQGKDFNKDF